VQRFKQRQAYDPRVDFYRRMRNAIVEMHEKGLHPRELDQIVARLSDEKKRIAISPSCPRLQEVHRQKAVHMVQASPWGMDTWTVGSQPQS